MFKSHYINKNTKGSSSGPVMFPFSLWLVCISHQNVGCDYGIDSNAVEDRCGVCLGDGKSCEMVYKSFDEEEGLGESRAERTGGGVKQTKTEPCHREQARSPSSPASPRLCVHLCASTTCEHKQSVQTEYECVSTCWCICNGLRVTAGTGSSTPVEK